MDTGLSGHVLCCDVQEMERRRYETEEQKQSMVPELRDVSRQMYLEKREAQKLVELEQELRDEEMLFAVGHSPVPHLICSICDVLHGICRPRSAHV